ncbi:MAG: SDR family NAD(P)-dependent oxidoreductase [Pseudomonadota bacterium]|nr:SDR family NAD(P)-dependent oxidoreductase [Pseudomonadota bacterium]
MSAYLITGAAMGLGRALTIQLVEAGHEVILLDKELKALNALYDELDSDLVALYPMDLLGANIDNYKELKEVIEENYGALDGVFLNAAILPAFTPIEHFDYMQWYEVLHTNLNANFHLTQMTLPLLNKAKNGKLVAVTDENISEHPAFYGAYGVAKAGLEQLMKTVAVENREQPADIYVAKLKTFATETRGRLFPGENPTQLPQAEEMATHLLDIVLHGLNAELVHKL